MTGLLPPGLAARPPSYTASSFVHIFHVFYAGLALGGSRSAAELGPRGQGAQPQICK
jgi:hypothetical protein